MTRKLNRKYSLSVVVPFTGTLILLIAAAVLAQVAPVGRPLGLANVVLSPARTSTPAQAERPLKQWMDSAAPLPVGRSQTKRRGASPMAGKQPVFSPPVIYNSGSVTSSVAIADVNGDHIPDVVVADSDGVGVMLGNGDGTLQPVVIYRSGGGAGLLRLVDLNGDGILDVVVAISGGQNNGDDSVGVLLGNGDGTFQPVVLYDSGGSGGISSLALSDLILNGKTDIVLCNPNSGSARVGTITVLMGNGNGTFQPPVVALENLGVYAWIQIALADVNNDGKPDLIMGGYPSEIYVLMGNGDGTFQPAVTYDSGTSGPSSLTLADVNGDGKLDILAGGWESYSLGVLLGNGDGTFQPAATYGSGPFWPVQIVVADINEDGKPDLLVADYNNSSGDVGVLLGNGDGTFQDVVNYSAGPLDSISVAVADLNGDGKPDVVVADTCNSLCTNGEIAVLFSANATTTSLVSSPNPSIFEQTVKFTASVSSDFRTPTGTVVFSDDSNVLGSATLARGKASLSVSSLAAGSHPITAAYQGGPAYSPSTSSPINQVVSTATTTSSLVSSQNPVLVTETVTYTATIASQYSGAATGTVLFQDGGSTISTATIAGNRAAYTTKYSLPGTHSIMATYSGDTNNVGSISAMLVEQVNKGGFPSETVLTTSGSPSFVDQPLTFNAKATSTHGAIPDGELVTFYDGTTAIGTGDTANGVATFVTSSLTAKTHTVKATYNGDAIFEPNSGTVKQVVDKCVTTTALSSSVNPSTYKQAVTFTATVTSAGPTPSGKVSFRDGTTAMASSAVKMIPSTLPLSPWVICA